MHRGSVRNLGAWRMKNEGPPLCTLPQWATDWDEITFFQAEDGQVFCCRMASFLDIIPSFFSIVSFLRSPPPLSPPPLPVPFLSA
jgi:hypothetical protein